MSLAQRVLAGLGPALRQSAGPLLEDVVAALVSGVERAHQLVQRTQDGWAAGFDARVTPDPRWLGNSTGTEVPAGLTLEQQRTYLTERPGWRNGTVEGMKAAVRAVLGGDTKRVDILERVDGNPYRFGLRVWESELPVLGGLPDTGAVIAAALTQKPVGLLTDVDVEIVDHDATYAHLTAAHGTYAQLAAQLPTGTAAAAHVPEEGTPD